MAQYRAMTPLMKVTGNVHVAIAQTQAKRWANSSEILGETLENLSRIDRYEHVERSMHMFISTVMNMWNGRYEMTFSWVSPDFFVGFIRFSLGFRPIISMLLLEI